MTKRTDTERFYYLLNRLEKRVGGKRTLTDFDSNMSWPARGVYFFFEHGEFREGSTSVLRVVRVGTHALKPNGWTRLAHRLQEHKEDYGRSVFRDHLRKALKNRSITRGTHKDHRHETCVSDYICAMPFLWLDVAVENGHLIRKQIEVNSIALLSDHGDNAVDKQSSNWLGSSSPNPKIRGSGLWNVDYVIRQHKQSFLDALEARVEQTGPLFKSRPGWSSNICL